MTVVSSSSALLSLEPPAKGQSSQEMRWMRCLSKGGPEVVYHPFQPAVFYSLFTLCIHDNFFFGACYYFFSFLSMYGANTTSLHFCSLGAFLQMFKRVGLLFGSGFGMCMQWELYFHDTPRKCVASSTLFDGFP